MKQSAALPLTRCDNRPVPRAVAVCAFLALLLVAAAQTPSPRPRGGDAGSSRASYSTDIPYDGRFTFVRLRWRPGGSSRGFWSTAWDHDYPRAEQNVSEIIRELTTIDVRQDGSRVLTLDDPELTHYPIAFMW